MDYPSDEEIESFIRARFEENFEQLRFTSGHGLSPDFKETALRQAILYWRRLRDVALAITDTEVRLNLPGQRTPMGREFGIEGVVDIVREQGRITLYDIKTQDMDSIQRRKDDYERQLNVYAYIWQNLRGERLDETAIIATQFPDEVKAAWEQHDFEALQQALAEWDPVVEIDFNQAHVDEMIARFACTVDEIEDGHFAPPPLDRLAEHISQGQTFATRVCRNCDTRFSCSAYRHYAVSGGLRDSSTFRRYYEDFGDEETLESWHAAALG